MKKFKTIIGMWVALSVILLTGCVDEFEANISEMPIEGLVIEGDIISDSTVVFHLNKKLPLTFTDENDVFYDDYMNVDAELSVMGSDGTSWIGQALGEGQYRVEIGTLKPEVEYHLVVKYEGDTYQSAPQKPLTTVGIENLRFIQPDLNGPVIILLNSEEGDVDDSKYYLWHFEEDWELRAEYVTTSLYNEVYNKIERFDYPPVAQGWRYKVADQYVLGTTESMVMNQIIDKTLHSIKNTDNRLSVLYSIRVYQRSLTQREYEYYYIRAKLNKDMGGLFTPQPSELPSNITCSNPLRKAIGYVGCNMTVSQSQLYIPTEEVAYVNKFDCAFGQEPAGGNRDKFKAGFQTCDDTPSWARIECVDITKLSADPQGRPEWWPNPYLYYKETPAVGDDKQ